MKRSTMSYCLSCRHFDRVLRPALAAMRLRELAWWMDIRVCCFIEHTLVTMYEVRRCTRHPSW